MTDPQTIAIELTKIIVYFALGFISGYLVRTFQSKIQITVANERIIALAVTSAWLLSVIVDMLNSSYETPIPIHTIMGLIVGFYFKKIISDGKQN